MTFDSFRLDPRLTAGIVLCGYTIPTPIQEQGIPPVMEGHDVMGLAQTGTGKTAAYALPIMERLLTGPRGSLRALIVAPTRELAEQIAEDFRDLGRKVRLTVLTIYGGIGINPQIDALRRGVDVVVACPGRLLDHISQGTVDLTKIQVLVLDEADMMLDMGFLPDVRRIIKNLPAERQNLLYSATMPEDIRHLADAILRDPVTVQIGHSAPVETVSHALYPVPQHLKTALLIELLRHTDTESVLIFTRTKHRAKKLGEKLAREGYRATSLQGNLSQRARQAALGGFRDGSYKVLVATDIAARGIDVTQISHVINYDIPDTTDAYTHRIGRTGRALHSGDAFTLVTEQDTILVRDIEKVLGTPIERRTVSGFDYKAPAPRRETEFAWDARPGTSSSRPQRSVGRDSQSASARRHHENSVNPPKSLNHRSATRRPANIRTS
ncbi:MAG: DEAD/DEAH box helicase [Caldiserica bacterium]|nr:DEAD/DEAH box helicase [Caldisericota bacterium]